CSIGEDVSVWIVTRWQRCQVISERLHQRQHDAPSRLARCERNLAGVQIDRAPREPSQVAESLADIEPEQNKATPFGIFTTCFEDSLDFRKCESASLRFPSRF